MKITRCIRAIACAVALLGGATTAWSAVTQAEADRLGKDLTPTGAEKAGNKDGTIPAWDGGLTKAPAGWKPEQGYVDPFASEQPLFTITAENVEQHKDKLSPGMVAMLKKYPQTFRMPVYKSHRTFAAPQHVYDQTKKLAVQTSLDGLTINNFNMGGYPFPIPKTGTEVMYNHQTRWYGGYNHCGDWLPTRFNGEFYRVGFCEEVYQPTNMDRGNGPNDLFFYFAWYDAPSTLAGTVYLVHDSIDKTKGDRAAWIYNAGQRRVRRAPNVAYDNIDDGTEGMRTTDDHWGFNGPMDRYDWKLVGKKEMYVPYNAYKLGDSKLKYQDMVDKGHLKSDLMRYELHRVWVVEATLKEGMSHVLPKRVFYLDEDSWMVTLADGYDSRGNLWRVYSEPMIQLYDVPLMIQRAYMVHDLQNGNYIVSNVDNERPQPAMTFNKTGKFADFQVDAIRRKGTR
ncbi:DUF1329 domain-containing protein [Aromatoleum toluclasticum]|uniref:DUF1329 domain-containing protein n=1 Tax=Aromatoleum toluclasticum TaxID=92003 RepID=UPI00036E3B48|nr:DUF1329 domain-containing protein [Aromatoleum toluclasticum]